MKNKNVKALVVASNSISALALSYIREKMKIPVIGMDPVIKSALYNHENEKVLVIASKMTLKGERYKENKEKYKDTNKIVEVSMPDLIELVEINNVQDFQSIKKIVDRYLKKVSTTNLNTVVLGDTHYIFFKDYFKTRFLGTKVIDGNLSTVKGLYNVLKDRGLLNDEKGTISLYNSLPSQLTVAKELIKG